MFKNTNHKVLLLIMSMIAVALLTGCSKQTTNMDVLQDQVRLQEDQIADLQSEIQEREQDLDRSRREAAEAAERAAEMERLAAASAVSGDDVAAAELLPPGAEAGECYARVLVPPVYETRSERVLVKDASEHIEIVPARYEWVEERVLVKEASERIETMPATYEWVEESMLVKPASTRVEDVPAVYEETTEQILVTPAREYWKKGNGLIERVDNTTGEIMCLVKEPAVYKTVAKRVLKTPATTREVEIPAEYETVRRQVVKTAATTRTVEIPAEYGTVKVRKMVEPAREVRSPVAAEYADVTQRVMVSESYMEWRQVLCETNMNNVTIQKIQRALLHKGHNPGPIDGIYGSQTRAAVNAFQKASNLPVGGLTYGTIEHLGIDLDG